MTEYRDVFFGSKRFYVPPAEAGSEKLYIRSRDFLPELGITLSTFYNYLKAAEERMVSLPEPDVYLLVRSIAFPAWRREKVSEFRRMIEQVRFLRSEEKRRDKILDRQNAASTTERKSEND